MEELFGEVVKEGVMRPAVAASLAVMLQYEGGAGLWQRGRLGVEGAAQDRQLDCQAGASGSPRHLRVLAEVLRAGQAEASQDEREVEAPADLHGRLNGRSNVRPGLGVGGIMYDPGGPGDANIEYFAARAGPELVESWRRQGQKQIIGQGELIPVFIAREVWHVKMQGREVFHFVDNNSAKDALIKGSSSHPASQEIVGAVWEQEVSLQSAPWYDRVPSPSNPSDDPSRGRIDALREAGAIQRVAALPAKWQFKGELLDFGLTSGKSDVGVFSGQQVRLE